MQVSYLISREVFPVMPAQAGIQDIPVRPSIHFWIPAYAGMTRVESKTPRFLSYL